MRDSKGELHEWSKGGNGRGNWCNYILTSKKLKMKNKTNDIQNIITGQNKTFEQI